MSKFVLIIGCFFLTSAVCMESVYTHAVTSIEGVNKPLNVYQGKKMLIVTLPIQQNSSSDSLLHSLDSINTVYAGSLLIIAAPAYEDGYTVPMKDSLKQWYRSILNLDIIVTEGLFTRKTSGSQQHPLFKWLTDKNLNDHFDRDISGPGDKFIIWTTGELIGVIGSQTRIGTSTVNELLQ